MLFYLSVIFSYCTLEVGCFYVKLMHLILECRGISVLATPHLLSGGLGCIMPSKVSYGKTRCIHVQVKIKILYKSLETTPLMNLGSDGDVKQCWAHQPVVGDHLLSFLRDSWTAEGVEGYIHCFYDSLISVHYQRDCETTVPVFLLHF